MDEKKVKELATSIGMGLGALHVLMNYGMEWDVAAIREALAATIEASRDLSKEAGVHSVV